MATDTATKPNDTKPAEAPKAATTTATPAKAATPKRKPASRTKAKTAAKSRTRTASKSRSTASKSRSTSGSKSRKPAAARTTRTETTKTATPTPAATARPQTKVLNEGQKFIAGLIEAQEKSVSTLVDYQTKAAEASQIPGATAVAEAQAKVLRSVTDTYVSAARAFLK
jgi:hypothetical protein